MLGLLALNQRRSKLATMGDILAAGVPSKMQSFRVSLGTLMAGTLLLAILTTFEPNMAVTVLVTMLMLVAAPIAVAIDIGLAAAQSRKSRPQFSLRQMFTAIACLAAYLSLLSEPSTFHLRFAASRSALQRLANDVAQGHAPPCPKWAGLFHIQKMEKKRRNGIDYTILWTEPGGSNPSGFVHPAPNPSWDLNYWSAALLHDPDWQFFIQD